MKDAEVFLAELSQAKQDQKENKATAAILDDFADDFFDQVWQDSSVGDLDGFDGKATAQAALNQQIESRAVALLAMREHGDKELHHKLTQKFPLSEALQQQYQIDAACLATMIAEVVDHCQQENWQSDERFIEQSVRSLTEKGQGPMKIRQKLQRASSRSDLISAYLDWDTSDWIDLARGVLEKKYGNCEKPKQRNEQAKRMRFLQSRGFGSDVIWQAFKNSSY